MTPNGEHADWHVREVVMPRLKGLEDTNSALAELPYRIKAIEEKVDDCDAKLERIEQGAKQSEKSKKDDRLKWILAGVAFFAAFGGPLINSLIFGGP